MPFPESNRQPSGPALTGSALCVLAVTATLLLWPGGQTPIQLRDSIEYIQWSDRRGVGYPLFLFIFGTGPTLAVVQTILSVVCWLYLGHQAGGRLGALLALIPACTLEIAQYNLLVLSESLSIPLFAALAGLTLQLMKKPSAWQTVLWSLVAMLFAFTRASNLYLVFCLPLFLCLRHRILGILLFAFCISLFLINKSLGHDPTGRYKAETMNHVYLYRVLPLPEAREHFETLGLPIHKWTMPYVTEEPRIAVYNADRKSLAHELLDMYPDYEAWMVEHGRSAYMKWLLKRPATYLEVFDGMRHSLDYYVLHAEGADLPRISQAIDWRYRLLGRTPFVLWLACLLIPAWDAFRRRALPEREALALLFMIPLTYASAFLGYHGHPGDVSRYLLPSTAFYHLSILLALSWIGKRVWKACQDRKRTN